MVGPGSVLRAAQPARVAEVVKEAAAKAMGSASGETLTRVKQHLSPAVAHFTVRHDILLRPAGNHALRHGTFCCCA